MAEITETVLVQLKEVRESDDVYLHSREQVAAEAQAQGFDELHEFAESASDATFHQALVKLS